MPHLVVLYTPNLEGEADMSKLCRKLADAMLAVRDEEGKQVFPTGGTRVLAFAANHYAVADSDPQRDYAFVYLNLRMASGRTQATQQRAGEAISQAAHAHFESLMRERLLGITVQVDANGEQVFDAKHSNIHPLFAKT
jgi:5-carboxymethyl-2-hydroxymuconate isomerase